MYLHHGVHVDRETFRQAFYHADDALIEKRTLVNAGLSATLRVQVFHVFEYLGISGEEEKRDQIVHSFLHDMMENIERNRGVLSRLSGRFRLGIVSNFYGNLERVCSELGIRSLFDVIVDSTLVGVTKPDPGIFWVALNTLEIAPHQGIYVGDNPYRDMAGAKAIGMPHILLSSQRVDPPHPCCPNDLIISNLAELERLIVEQATRPPVRVAS